MAKATGKIAKRIVGKAVITQKKPTSPIKKEPAKHRRILKATTGCIPIVTGPGGTAPAGSLVTWMISVMPRATTTTLVSINITPAGAVEPYSVGVVLDSANATVPFSARLTAGWTGTVTLTATVGGTSASSSVTVV